jgi:hypothetical protein
VLAIVDDAGNLRDAAGDPLAALVPGTEVEVRVKGQAVAVAGRHQIVLASVLVVAVVVGCLAVVGIHWPWTGFRGHETLWDWMSLLTLPVAIAVLPVRIAMADHVPARRWHYAWLAVALVLVVVIAGGYGLHWAWTGFHGKALWDWLHLLLFPVILVFLPNWFQRGAPVGRTGTIAAAVVAAAFAVVIIGGYEGPWRWTGFTGNTFRDWLALLIAPFLLPAACRWFHIQLAQQASHDRVREASARPAG